MPARILTFIIPLKHPENADDWDEVKRHLSETVRSIAHQDAAGWNAIIVANEGADLPALPPNFEVKRVDFPPNSSYALNSDRIARLRTFHLDKGKRVLAGLLEAGDQGHVMIVDHDDLVSRRLTSFVTANSKENGWFFFEGLIWPGGARLLYRYKDFSQLCGTSHILRADLYRIPGRLEDADESYLERMLGSHVPLRSEFDRCGSPLRGLPFIGAVYRTGHSESWSGFGLKQLFMKDRAYLRPGKLYRRLSRLRLKTARIDQEFFGR